MIHRLDLDRKRLLPSAEYRLGQAIGEDSDGMSLRAAFPDKKSFTISLTIQFVFTAPVRTTVLLLA